MGNMILAAVLLGFFSKGVHSVQVIVPQTERSTALFGSVILRCDYSTSATANEVIVTWKYKSFCKDPVLEYYSTAYQAALNLGQDPANDCPDRQRTVRVVIQKRGSSEPTLGPEYRERRITVQNKADLVINEVMWWDNGVYFCTIDAPGDTSGDSDKEIKLIVYHWLTVLFIIIGAILLIILLGVCCCQCCPQRCCCYVRCPCCPRTCCCPEKAVMQHRMMKEAKRAMAPWLHGQPVYAPMSNGSSQANPMLYPGSVSDYPVKPGIPLAPMAYPPPQQGPPMAPSAYGNGSIQGSAQGTNVMLDYLESQVRGMDVAAPLLHAQPAPPPQQRRPTPQQISVPFSQGPPSMLSALDEIGIQGVERRVIQMPPIVSRGSGGNRSGGGGGGRPSLPSSDNSSRGGGPPRRRGDQQFRDQSPRRGMVRSNSDESLLDDRYGRRAGGAGSSGGRQGGGARGRGGDGFRPRSRSRDDLMEEVRRMPPVRERSYSPLPRRHGSWSSDDGDSRRGATGFSPKGKKSWPEKPPPYTLDIQPGQAGRRNNDRFSEKSSRSGNSVVI